MEATDTTEATGLAAVEVLPGSLTHYVRVRWIADYFDVGLSTIYEAIEAGELPAIGVGRGAKKAIRVRLADVQAYEQSRQIQPKAAAAST
ncbi:helix-turn-helix domain-containing protein [Streptomyces sp. NPDC056527]|uniref:helix-turn-helix domain-containing protein n=1 Tax=Streptomyces sp. NPDC056527 TaxID=3345853 RepID=UPI0036CA08B5